jgi:hypothetical protein
LLINDANPSYNFKQSSKIVSSLFWF